MPQYKKLIEIGESDIKENSSVVSIVEGEIKKIPFPKMDERFNNTKSVSVIIPTDGWVNNSDTEATYPLSIDILVEGITEKMIPMLTILPESQQIARECELCNTSRTVDGALQVYAQKIPEAEISCILSLF